MSDDAREPLPGMIGRHPLMLAMYALVRRAAPTPLPMVIVGETGSGKELVARAIHQLSRQHDGPFIDVNCAAIADSLVEPELFGHVKGAFTGALTDAPGMLETADEGTLFLDEACSLKKAVQAKLLRAIERGEHRRVGSQVIIRSRYRLILAFQRPPRELLREDLYLPAFLHRVAGLTLFLPPLRRRRSDIRLLAEQFLADTARDCGRPLVWSEAALKRLDGLAWPGNVRELCGLISRLPVLAVKDVIALGDVLMAASPEASDGHSAQDLAVFVARHNGNISQAAAELGLPRNTLRNRLLRASAE